MSISPPRPSMPSLNALRAFEATARLNSISAAAEELCVTPSAIAQHVKALEAWAGEQLLKRNPRGVEVTPLAASVLAEFSLAFDQLGSAVQELRTHAASKEIRIAALPSIAQLWLSPRLPGIRSRSPDIHVSVTAIEQCPNLMREPYDMAIFYFAEKEAENEIVVSEDRIFPVASPSLARGILRIHDLENFEILHDTTWKDDWKRWLASCHPEAQISLTGPEYSLYSLAVEECKNGAGILMGHDALVAPQLQSGELKELFGKRVGTGNYLAIKTFKAIEPGSAVEQVINSLLD